VNLTEITRQRNDAMTKDFQTGFLTAHSLKTELAEYIQNNPNEKIALCSIRMLQLDEFLIVNNNKFNDIILGNLVDKLEKLFRPNLIARTSKGEFVGV
jgi:GGDEF domain-containing protein